MIWSCYRCGATVRNLAIEVAHAARSAFTCAACGLMGSAVVLEGIRERASQRNSGVWVDDLAHAAGPFCAVVVDSDGALLEVKKGGGR